MDMLIYVAASWEVNLSTWSAGSLEPGISSRLCPTNMFDGSGIQEAMAVDGLEAKNASKI